MKKTLTKILAIFLSVCLLVTSPVFVALAEENNCPIESVNLTLHRPMYENIDGYWEYSDELGEEYFYYSIEEYIRSAATINVFYTDGSFEKFTYDEFNEIEELDPVVGLYLENWQGERPLQVGDEIEAYFDIYYIPTKDWVFYDFNTSIEEVPVESVTAEATKSLIENAMGEEVYDGDADGYYYEYDVTYSEPVFTIKWKDSSREDTRVDFNNVSKLLYAAPSLYSNQSFENQWSAGNTYTATASVLGVECDFDVSVISLDVVGISAKPTNKAILGVDNYYSYDYENEEEFYEFNFDRFFPEITLTFENECSVTIPYGEFDSKTNYIYFLDPCSTQTSKTPWDKVGNYSFDISLSVWDNPDFEPLTYTVPVEVVANPIEKIEVVATEPVNANEYWEEYIYDENTGEFIGKYNYYYGSGEPKITLYYTDGTVKGPMYPDEIEELFDYRYYYNYYNDQSYYNPWDLGEHTITCEFMGHSYDYKVLLTDRFVKSIKVVDAKLSDNEDNGYYNENNDFIYHNDFAFDLEFTLWDDSKVTQKVYGNSWCDYGFISVTDTQEVTPWVKGGENTFTVTLEDEFGAVSTTTGNVEITEYFEYGYYFNSDGIVITEIYGKPSEILEIPEEIDGYSVVAVTSLYPNNGNAELVEEIIIPDSVKTISGYALVDFENLKSVKLGSGITFISEELTVNNPKLESLEISAENSNYYSSQNAIFTKDKTELVAIAPACTEMITLPAECIDIDVLYNYPEAYKNIKIGYQTEGDYCVKENGITYSKDKTAVILCDTETTGEVVLPSTVTSIASHAFENCDKITAVTINGSVTNISYAAFADCTSLASIKLPNSLESIGGYAFAGCTNLTSVNLPNQLENIEFSAFRSSGLKNITVPDSVVSIGYNAFAYSQLETAKLGSGLKSMESSFYECENLKSVNIPAGIEYFDGAFADCPSLSSVTLENGLKIISSNAFLYCKSLTAIDIPATVTTIEDSAFNNTGLTSVTIPNSVTYLGEYAFAFSRDLVTATLGSGVKNIGKGAFSGTALKTIKWGSKVETIEVLAFSNAELESVEIPNTVTSIMYAAFENNSNLSSIKIPSSVESVGSHTFDGTAWYMAQNKGLTYIDNILYRYKGDVTDTTVVNIQNGTRLIADAAFEHKAPEMDDPEWFNPDSYYNLSGISEINIPNSVEGIGNIAFLGLPGLTEITLPNKLTYLGKFPFADCENLTTVNIGKSTANFDIYTFVGAFGIEEITVDPQNTKYASVDGVLYNKNLTELIYCPAAKTGDLVVPASVKTVAAYAFSYNNLSSITFSNPDVNIDYYAFNDYQWYYNKVENYYEVYSWSFPETDVVLKAPANSLVEAYADNRYMNFEAVEVVKEQQTGISVSETAENAIPQGATLVVESVEPTEENTVVFDITLECEGEAVQPNAPVTVKIPLPAGIDAQLCKVYRIEADGSKTNMNASVTNGFIYFTTNHFSLYVIESSFLPGDINGDGDVTLQDVVALSQIVAEWENVDHVEAALDPNGDGYVTLQDVVHLAQFVAEWDVTLSDEAYSAE